MNRNAACVLIVGVSGCQLVRGIGEGSCYFSFCNLRVVPCALQIHHGSCLGSSLHSQMNFVWACFLSSETRSAFLAIGELGRPSLGKTCLQFRLLLLDRKILDAAWCAQAKLLPEPHHAHCTLTTDATKASTSFVLGSSGNSACVASSRKRDLLATAHVDRLQRQSS